MRLCDELSPWDWGVVHEGALSDMRAVNYRRVAEVGQGRNRSEILSDGG